ncbi:MAG: DUF5320 domain-containing protein [Patescibacteria group bacterium]|nr:DUF5320 domain-containing protein [Patescibacteria group bacterium]
MPRFDGTGPMGQGPRTGRSAGYCGAGVGVSGYGCGLGFRRGCGARGFLTRKEESEMLKDETKLLENELQAVKERLAEVEGQK